VLKIKLEPYLAGDNDPSNYIRSYDLKNFLVWTSDINLCYESQVSQCTNEFCD